MALDAEWDAKSREHTARQQSTYRKRVGEELVALNTEIRAQNKADLKALADADGLSIGQCQDRLIEDEVARRAARMGKRAKQQEVAAIM